MKKLIAAAMLLGMGTSAVIASPIYPADLRWDCKTPYVQLQHQSGWNYCTEIQPAPASAPVKKSEPAKQAMAVPQGEWVLKGVNFETNSDRLQPSSLVVLNEAAATLNANPSVNVEVQGHTDNVGEDNANQALSQRRADAVKVYLVEKGVSGTRLSSKGYGESKPIADNQTADGRSNNRRIEFKVISR